MANLYYLFLFYLVCMTRECWVENLLFSLLANFSPKVFRNRILLIGWQLSSTAFSFLDVQLNIWLEKFRQALRFGLIIIQDACGYNYEWFNSLFQLFVLHQQKLLEQFWGILARLSRIQVIIKFCYNLILLSLTSILVKSLILTTHTKERRAGTQRYLTNARKLPTLSI